MRPVLTPEEAAALDALADVDVERLVERAALGLAISCSRRGVGYGDRVSILVGPGHNGADGYALARHLLARGARPEVLALAPPRARATIAFAERAEAVGITITDWRPPGAGDGIVVDAVFGAGFRGPLPDDVAEWAGAGDLRLAVDLPSGLSGHTGETLPVALPADWTVTFHAPKRGHILGAGPDHVGVLEVVDIGLPDVPVSWAEQEDGDDTPRPRVRSDHKWSVGGVAVIGGAPGMSGAPVLAARAAMAAGAGAALVARPPTADADVPFYLLGATLGTAPELDTTASGDVLALADRWQVLVLGPGLGSQAAGLVATVVDRWPGPLVLDADALVPGLDDGLRRRSAPTVVTPHAGEFARLTGRTADPFVAVEYAVSVGAVVVLKGSPTVVADGASVRLITSGGPELATIGTGDVLAGMIGAALARGADALPAAAWAAHQHGRAGRVAATTGALTIDGLIDAVRA